MSHICVSCIALFIGICGEGGGGVLLILSRVSARCDFHKSLNWARLVQGDPGCWAMVTKESK
jgi:hypothetical protein